MPFKPVGVDENGNLAPRVMSKLAETFVKKPSKINDGQVLAWNSDTLSWEAITLVTDYPAPPKIDGGSPSS